MIRTLMRRDSIPGAAVAVLKSGKIVFEDYSGYANLELRKKIGKHSIFQIASVSKQFTAAAVLLLSEEGKLKLADQLKIYSRTHPTNGKLLP